MTRTIEDAIATLPAHAEEGEQRHFPGTVLGYGLDGKANIGTAIFGYYGGRWERYIGRATSESGIKYNDFQPVR